MFENDYTQEILENTDTTGETNAAEAVWAELGLKPACVCPSAEDIAKAVWNSPIALGHVATNRAALGTGVLCDNALTAEGIAGAVWDAEMEGSVTTALIDPDISSAWTAAVAADPEWKATIDSLQELNPLWVKVVRSPVQPATPSGDR
jgi:hypothetical protein